MKKKGVGKRKNKFMQKKFWGAFLLGLLVVTGGAAALPIVDGRSVSDNQFYGNFKQIQNDPLQFINAENLALPEDFDYFKELNKDFVNYFPDEEVFDERDLDMNDTKEESEAILGIKIEFVDPEDISEVQELRLEVPIGGD